MVTSDGAVLAEHEGSHGTSGFVGSADDLHRNLNELIAAAGLTDDEDAEFRGADRDPHHPIGEGVPGLMDMAVEWCREHPSSDSATRGRR